MTEDAAAAELDETARKLFSGRITCPLAGIGSDDVVIECLSREGNSRIL